MALKYKKYMEVPTSSLEINDNGDYDTLEIAKVIVDVENPKPEETFNITPTTETQTITPTEGYVFSGGTVQAIPVSSLDSSIINGQSFEEETGDYGWKSTINIPAGYHESQTLEKTFSEIFPAPETPGTAGKVLLGYQFYDKDGKKVTGSMPNNGAATYTITEMNGTYTIPAGYHNGNGIITAGEIERVSSIPSTKTTDLVYNTTDNSYYIWEV